MPTLVSERDPRISIDLEVRIWPAQPHEPKSGEQARPSELVLETGSMPKGSW